MAVPIHQLLRDRSGELGLTQVDLSRRVGLGQDVVSKWFNGVHIPGVEWADLIATAIELQPEEVEQSILESQRQGRTLRRIPAHNHPEIEERIEERLERLREELVSLRQRLDEETGRSAELDRDIQAGDRPIEGAEAEADRLRRRRGPRSTGGGPR